MRKQIILVFFVLSAIIQVGCVRSEPQGYTEDQTPTHDGENWRGGREDLPGARDMPPEE